MPKNTNSSCVWDGWVKKCNDPEIKSILKKLRELSFAPSNADVYNTWLEANDAMNFLANNAQNKWVVVYFSSFSSAQMLSYGVFVPKIAVTPPNLKDMFKWPYNSRESWCVCDDESQTWINPPLAGSGTGSRTLEKGEQLVFIREDNEHRDYIEILQKYAHVSGTHRDTQQGIWYKIGSGGKKEPVVRALTGGVERVVLFRRDILSTYAELTDSVMVRVFCFKKISDKFIGWGSAYDDYVATDDKKIHYRYCFIPNYASDSNGFQIVEFAVSR